MKFHRATGRPKRLALLDFGALVAGGPIAADQLGEITVTAARMGRKAVNTEVEGHSYATGAPLDRVTLAWSVPFSNLDLSKHSGATELDKRIHARALAGDRWTPSSRGRDLSSFGIRRPTP